uniref:Uncharacterized protein n=1 Tax=Oryza rufipogon TaxID=4529 RepID=A0A0E0Q0J4_ORYRU
MSTLLGVDTRPTSPLNNPWSHRPLLSSVQAAVHIASLLAQAVVDVPSSSAQATDDDSSSSTQGATGNERPISPAPTMHELATAAAAPLLEKPVPTTHVVVMATLFHNDAFSYIAGPSHAPPPPPPPSSHTFVLAVIPLGSLQTNYTVHEAPAPTPLLLLPVPPPSSDVSPVMVQPQPSPKAVDRNADAGVLEWARARTRTHSDCGDRGYSIAVGTHTCYRTGIGACICISTSNCTVNATKCCDFAGAFYTRCLWRSCTATGSSKT